MKSISLIFYILFYLIVCVCTRAPCMNVHIWQSEDNLLELGFAFHHVGPEIKLRLFCLVANSFTL